MRGLLGLCEAGQACVCESDVAAERRFVCKEGAFPFGLCLRSSLTLVGIVISMLQQDMNAGKMEKVSEVT